MFAYVDPTIRDRLVNARKLLRIDPQGKLIGPDNHADEHAFTLNILGPIPLPLDVGQRLVIWDWYTFVRHTELLKAREIAAILPQRGDQRLLPLLNTYMAVNSVLVHGDLAKASLPLVRVHSSCLTGDVFGSKRCECGPQLDKALEAISGQEAGALVYMAGHEGRGIGLWAKAITYLLQDAGEDTYQANRSLGLPEDCRDFHDAAAILLYFLGGDRPFRLLTNNPKKQSDLYDSGLTGFQVVKHLTGVNPYNRRYLLAKRDWGHQLDPEELQGLVAERADVPPPFSLSSDQLNKGREDHPMPSLQSGAEPLPGGHKS
ncbi:MAG: GTP cyclohydrolase II [Bradymonadales bacterium]|nr:GTP cyclohydrolase II [Bradymonadales bacterium]